MTVEQGLQKRNLSLETKRLQAVERQAAALVEAKEQAEKLSEFKSTFATMAPMNSDHRWAQHRA